MSSVDRREPEPVPGKDRVFPVVIKLLSTRINAAEKEHRSPLMTHNGRDALMDAIQECIDTLMYLVQAYMEREEPKL